MHGANRLASNSLLEGLVFAERVARDMIDAKKLPTLPRKKDWDVPALRDRGAAQVAADSIRQVMWDYCGIDRSAKGLRLGHAKLDRDRVAAPGRRDRGAEHGTDISRSSRMRRCCERSRAAAIIEVIFRAPKRKWSGKHIEW